MNRPRSLYYSIDGLSNEFGNAIFLDCSVLVGTVLYSRNTVISKLNDGIKSLDFYIDKIENDNLKFIITPGIDYEFFEKGTFNLKKDLLPYQNYIKGKKENRLRCEVPYLACNYIANLLKLKRIVNENDLNLDLREDDFYQNFYEEFKQIKDPLKLSEVDYELLISALTYSVKEEKTLLVSNDVSIMMGWSFILHQYPELESDFGFAVRISKENFDKSGRATLDTISKHIVKINT